MKKVSIIIPVYNVADYLSKCVNSVLNQTYKNLEIIIVNDGSTDNSMELCEALTKNYDNVKIISQKNQGLSAARNTGIACSSGDYLYFLDGDDYINKDAITTVMANIGNNDICITQYDMVSENGSSLNRVKRFQHEKEFNNIAAINTVLNSDSFGGIIAPAKLYKKRLFTDNNITFPIGKYNEDCFTTYKLFLAANRVKYIPFVTYYYVQRENSITHNKVFSVKYLDKLQAARQCYEKLNNYDQLRSTAISVFVRWNLQVANLIFRTNCEKEYLKNLNAIKSDISKLNYLKCNELSLKYKIQTSIFIKNFKLYKGILKIGDRV